MSTPLERSSYVAIPKEPSDGILMSMALRYDHGLGSPGYYDQEMFGIKPSITHAQRLESTLTTMRQLYEEITRQGFYQDEKEDYYASLRNDGLLKG